MGMGYYTRANSEPCLLATRGSPLRLAFDVPQVILAPVGAHSAKPNEAHARIERLVAGPYLELFARKSGPAGRPGATRCRPASCERRRARHDCTLAPPEPPRSS